MWGGRFGTSRWSFSYDLRVIEYLSRSVRVADGNTRADVYHPFPGQLNRWVNTSLARELTYDPVADEFTLLFANHGRWIFNPKFWRRFLASD
jgi:hypothetical protein